MAPAEALLKIPTVEVNRWPWLDASLVHAAGRAGVAVDDAEMVGSYRTYRFSQLSAVELKPIVDYALMRGGEGVWARVSGENEITVQVGFDWIRPMGIHRPTIDSPHSYFVVFRELCKLLAWDERWKAWWATSGHLQFNFHQKDGDPEGPWEWNDGSFVYGVVPLDLSILTVENPTRLQIERQALLNVRLVLHRLAQRLDAAPPPLPAPFS
jgi:hypothetical protein